MLRGPGAREPPASFLGHASGVQLVGRTCIDPHSVTRHRSVHRFRHGRIRVLPAEPRLCRPPPHGEEPGFRIEDPLGPWHPSGIRVGSWLCLAGSNRRPTAGAQRCRTLRVQSSAERSSEKAKLARPYHGLNPRSNAQEPTSLLQVLLNCALGDSEDLADIAGALACFSPAQAFKLTTTEDHQIPL